uniref:Uncharacterized protein n=1 Tax=Monodelphis domestica TaxID=13616 RepID=A0A5F8GDA8_MONDO
QGWARKAIPWINTEPRMTGMPAFNKDHISESPTEAPDIGFGNRCRKPKGPRDPPSGGCWSA